nr:WXG100 family type VII secretion target [Kibdelosporangium sp. MJ126-NF4]CEL16312.1 hypothetical protein [Kibdelosporangium sp. MJ126-NF4]CTQ94236.1 hypothetical protein [Kibdelosporangium sp. MJ126-NF4]
MTSPNRTRLDPAMMAKHTAILQEGGSTLGTTGKQVAADMQQLVSLCSGDFHMAFNNAMIEWNAGLNKATQALAEIQQALTNTSTGIQQQSAASAGSANQVTGMLPNVNSGG